MPKIGVYVTHTLLAGTRHDSVTNVGHKPTFGDDHRLTVETFLLNYSGDIAETEMEIRVSLSAARSDQFSESRHSQSADSGGARRSVKFFRLLKNFARRPMPSPKSTTVL